MADSIFSPSWHRVASLVPQLRTHTQIHRHHYRGELWYVLQDHLTSSHYRFTPAAYYIIGLMNGKRTIQEIWDLANEKLGDDAPTQDEMIQLLSQLHAADTLKCDVPPDVAELLIRQKRHKKSKWLSRFMNPLSLRFPLIDPEKFLSRIVPTIKRIPAWVMITAWCLIVGVALILAAMHWPELTENISDQVLTPKNLLLIWLIFPIVKALHELGHAIAVKVWGGEVHEMGIMFLVLMPIPYVDASAASSFREARKRVVVGAAGMIVEVFIAALALFVWLLVGPGMIHAIAYNIILIAGVSTLLFNANPLLRFDGYYIFSDITQIPNLATRSNKYLGYLVQRYIFLIRNIKPPHATAGERRWFVFYGIASFIYRMFIVVLIVLFISGKFFIVGVLLAIWALIMMLIVPSIKALSQLYTNPQIRPKRQRAVTITASTIAVSIMIIMLLPLPSWTRAEGIVWVEGDAVVRAGVDCFVVRILTKPGTRVKAGVPLIECHNPEVITRINKLRARLDELQMTHNRQLAEDDKVKAVITKEEIKSAEAELKRVVEQAENLLLRSKTNGIFIVPNAKDLKDKFIQKGKLIGYILDAEKVTVKVAIDQQDIDLVRNRTKYVEIRLAENLSRIIRTKIDREVPAATDQLPSAALTTEGGGEITMDPSSQTPKAYKKVFLVDLALPDKPARINVGGRVYVKFNYSFEPLGSQWYRALKQTFLGHFDV